MEGPIKQLVNRRLKLTGARCPVDRVGPLVELGALIDTPDWHAFWAAARRPPKARGAPPLA